MLIILQMLAVLAVAAVVLIGLRFGGVRGKWFVISIILVAITALVSLIEIRKPRQVDLTLEAQQKIIAGIRGETHQESQVQEIPIDPRNIEDPELRRLVEKGQAEEARAEKIADAIRRGDDEAAKQYAAATRKAIACYRQGLAANPKTSERCALFHLIGAAHYRLSELTEAQEAWEEALRLAAEMTKSPELVREGKEAGAATACNLGIICGGDAPESAGD